MCVSFSANAQILKFKIGDVAVDRMKPMEIEQTSRAMVEQRRDRTYALLSFEQMPSEAQKKRLSSYISFIQYMPEQSWYIQLNRTIPADLIESTAILAIHGIEEEWKLSPELDDPAMISWALKDAGNIRLRVSLLADANNPVLRSDLGIAGAFDLVVQGQSDMLELTIAMSGIAKLADIAEVYWIEPVPPPVEANNLVERTNHRVPMLEKNAGIYDLTGRNVVVGEWDGGGAGPHADYDDRHTRVEPFYNNSNGRHATHVAGTVLSAGILNPDATGMAPEASLFSWDFGGSITTEMDTGAAKYGIEITQNSYGYNTSYDNCTRRTNYDASSRAIDQLVNKYPHLLHVYAAGNSRSSNCLPGGYRTVHSGYQSGKNTLVVAAITSTDGNSSFHGYGPMRDGRLKPDISAVGVNVYSTLPYNNYQGGWNGTSMACPGTSGTSALIYELYENIHGARPSAHLIKNFMCNGADDIGRPGPDFQFGFGRLNGWNAAQMLSAGRYALSNVRQNQVWKDTIRIKRGMAELRVMLCWDDLPASSSSSVSLVNDLDLFILSSNGDTIRPWVLDAASYTANAKRGRDSLNNVEQITLENPAYTTYIIHVVGKKVTGNNQEFSVSWMDRDTGLMITYPNGGENWVPPSNSGSAQLIRWESTGLSGIGILEYSLDSGTNWSVISNSVQIANGYFNWTNCPSNARSARALIRISKGTYSDQSDRVFHIFPRMSSPTAVVCDSQIHLKWNALSGAQYYRVWLNTGGKMLPIDTTSNPYYTVRGLQNDSTYWLAVSAIGADDAEGPRSWGASFIPRSTYTPPRYTQQPRDTALCNGSSLRWSIDFTGTQSINWSWQYSEDEGQSWKNTGVNNNKQLSLTNIPLNYNQRLYRVVATNRCESPEYSRSIRLQVDTALQFSYAHQQISLCLGQDSLIRVNYLGPNEPASQWFYQSSLSTSPRRIGQLNTSSWPIKNVRASEEGYYHAVLSNTCGNSSGSLKVFLDVRDTLRLQVSGNDTICLGETVRMRLQASGGDPNAYAYEWRLRNLKIAGPLVQYQPDSTEIWRAQVYDYCSVDTVELQVEIPVRPDLTLVPLRDTLICRGNPVKLKAQVTGGYIPGYSYKWSGGLSNQAEHLIYPESDTVFTLEFSDQCTRGMRYDSMRIQLRAPLHVQIQSNKDTLCHLQPQRFNLLFSGGKSDQYRFIWSEEEKTASEMLRFTQSGWLRVQLQDGCTIEPGQDSMWIHVYDSIQLNILGPNQICQGTGGVYTLNIQGGHPDRTRWNYQWNGLAGEDRLLWIPVQSGVISATAADGCSQANGTAMRSIEVFDSLRLFTSEPMITICKGQQAELKWTSTGGDRNGVKYLMNETALGTDTIRLVSPEDTSLYNLVVSDGCTQPSDTIQIQVNVRPALTLDAGPDLHQCLFDEIEIQLVADGGLSQAYAYYANGVELSGNRYRMQVDSNAKIAFRLSDGCSSEDALDSLQIQLSDFSSNFIRIQDQKNLNLLLTGGNNLHQVQWNFGEGAGWQPGGITQKHSFSTYGPKTVCRVEIDSIGCRDTTCREIRVFDVFETGGFSIDVYPNPTREGVQVVLGDVAGMIELNLYSAEGKLLYKLEEENYRNQQYSIPMLNFARGMYFLRVRANAEEKIVKVVRE